MPRTPVLTTLIKAAKAWDVVRIKEVVNARPELVMEHDRSGRTCLHYVATQDARKNHRNAKASVGAAKVLINAGADFDAVQEIHDDEELFPATPVWTAYTRGNNLVLLRYLLGLGASPQHTLWACAWNDDVATAKLLVKHGAELDPVFHGQTPFHEAAGWRRWKFVNWIAAQGANVNFKAGSGDTALHVAIRKKFKLDEIRQLLKLGVNPRIENNAGESALRLASTQNRTRVLKVLSGAN